jgi:hypothetical protein
VRERGAVDSPIVVRHDIHIQDSSRTRLFASTCMYHIFITSQLHPARGPDAWSAVLRTTVRVPIHGVQQYSTSIVVWATRIPVRHDRSWFHDQTDCDRLKRYGSIVSVSIGFITIGSLVQFLQRSTALRRFTAFQVWGRGIFRFPLPKSIKLSPISPP